MAAYLTIRLDAGRDRSGNPRRVFVTYDVRRLGEIAATYDEQYSGPDAITNPHHRRAWHGMTHPTSVSAYRDLVDFSAGNR